MMDTDEEIQFAKTVTALIEHVENFVAVRFEAVEAEGQDARVERLAISVALRVLADQLNSPAREGKKWIAATAQKLGKQLLSEEFVLAFVGNFRS